MTNGAAIVSGLIVAGYLVIAMYFLRFWRESADRLFLFFSAAFLLLAVQRLLLVTLPPSDSLTTVLYATRAFAFCIILYAIIDKNRKT